MEQTFSLIDDKVRANAITAVALAPLGKEIAIRDKRKTPPQRRLFHKLVAILCDDTGYSLIELKTIIKEQVFGLIEFKDRKGKLYTRHISSEELSTKEYSKLIDHCYHLGDLAGINLPDPSYYGMEI